jgi:RNA polymerase sigma factor (sigma-70 family)
MGLIGAAALTLEYITPSQLQRALDIQKRADERGEPHRYLGEIMKDLGFLTEDQIRIALSTSRSARSRRPAPTIPESIDERTVQERDVLYAEFQPLVRRLIKQYGETREMRQDLEGEIFYRFCTILAEFDPSRGVPLRGYLVRRLIASVYTYARSQWNRKSQEVNLELDLEKNETIRPVEPPSDWDRDLIRKEFLEECSEAIQRLPERQRQVIVWRFYHSNSFGEIAQKLGVCEATARSLLRHGMNNMRRKLAEIDPGYSQRVNLF